MSAVFFLGSLLTIGLLWVIVTLLSCGWFCVSGWLWKLVGSALLSFKAVLCKRIRRPLLTCASKCWPGGSRTLYSDGTYNFSLNSKLEMMKATVI